MIVYTYFSMEKHRAGLIRWRDLPDDMQVLLADFFQDLRNEDTTKPYREFTIEDLRQWEQLEMVVYQIPVEPLWQQIKDMPWDYRGVEHVREIVKDMVAPIPRSGPIPPIIIRSIGATNVFYDGRHRLWAAHLLGRDYILAIDLADWFPIQV